MLAWLQSNLAPILVALVLLIVITLTLLSLSKDKKAGKHICGGTCGNCPMAGSCHSKGLQKS